MTFEVDTIFKGNEMRDDKLTTVVVDSSEEIPFGSYFTSHVIELKIEKK